MVYQYKIGLVLAGGREILVGPVSVEALEPLPKAFALMQNYPNPFHQGTNIRFQMPVSGRARLSIYDPAGRLMRILMDADTEPGDHTVTWDGRDGTGRRISAGVYFYRLTTDSFTAIKKMVVIR
jgi:hypothetical protein